MKTPTSEKLRGEQEPPARSDVLRTPGGVAPIPSARAGFTLPETMLGVMIFAMVMLGVYAGLIESYRLSALSRYRDNARAVLRSYVDQFQRLQTTIEIPGREGSAVRWLFDPTGNGFTGKGLVWGRLSDDNEVEVPEPPDEPLPITLGTEGYLLNATVTRRVRFVKLDNSDSPEQGLVSLTSTDEGTGYMAEGTFMVTFTYGGKTYNETLTVLRTVP